MGTLTETALPIGKYFAVSLPAPYPKLKLGENSGNTRPTLFVEWGKRLGMCHFKKNNRPQLPLSKTFVNDCNEDIFLFLPRRERFVTSSNQRDPLNCWSIYFALWTQTGTVTSTLSHYKGCKHVPSNFLKDDIWVTSTSFFIIFGNDKMYKGQKQKCLPMLRTELFFHAKFTKKINMVDLSRGCKP